MMKPPSERIQELAERRVRTRYGVSAAEKMPTPAAEICDVIAYLDEQYEEQQEQSEMFPEAMLTPFHQHQADVDRGCVVQYQVCGLCGFREWIGTLKPREGIPGGVSLEPFPLFGRGCNNCTQADQRSPEVVRWVIGVASLLSARLRGR